MPKKVHPLETFKKMRKVIRIGNDKFGDEFVTYRGHSRYAIVDVTLPHATIIQHTLEFNKAYAEGLRVQDCIERMLVRLGYFKQPEPLPTKTKKQRAVTEAVRAALENEMNNR